MATPSKEVELPRTDIENKQEITKIISEFLGSLEEGKLFLIILKESFKSTAFPDAPPIIGETQKAVIKRKGNSIQICCCFIEPKSEGSSSTFFINTDLSLLVDEIAQGDQDLTALRKVPDEKHLSLLSLYWMLRDAIIKPAKLELRLCPW